MIALTATATARVQTDIIKQLGMNQCCLFDASFNRTNLFYEVRKKKKEYIQEISSFIKDKYPEDSGIIYCFSRRDCETVRDQLIELGHDSVAVYHAGLPVVEKQRNHDQWSKDEVKIMVATIAFGMGINKPDVRYVIHHSLPKSIEDYYQESGRAGRDGKTSHCLLYYTYGDKAKQQSLMLKDAAKTTNRDNNFESLNRIVSYCENDTDCRRVVQLAHFGEQFDRKVCNQMCDNCKENCDIVQKDYTAKGVEFLQIVKEVGDNLQSLSHCIMIWRGSKAQKLVKLQHDKISGHGGAKQIKGNLVDRIAAQLILEGYLNEQVVASDYGNSFTRLNLNKQKMSLLESGRNKLMLNVKGERQRATLDVFKSSKTKTTNKKGQKDVQKMVDLCLKLLQEVRHQISKENGVHPYHILTSDALEALAEAQPINVEQLLQVERLGKNKAKLYGVQILTTIRQFRHEHVGDVDPLTEEEKKQIKEELGGSNLVQLSIKHGHTPPNNKRNYATFITDNENSNTASSSSSSSKYFAARSNNTNHGTNAVDLTDDDFWNNDDIDKQLDELASMNVEKPAPSVTGKRTVTLRAPSQQTNIRNNSSSSSVGSQHAGGDFTSARQAMNNPQFNSTPPASSQAPNSGPTHRGFRFNPVKK